MRAPRAAIAEFDRLRGAGDPFPDAAIDKEIRGIDVGGDPGLSAMQNVALGVFRDDDDAEHPPLIERPSRLGEIGRRLGDRRAPRPLRAPE